VQRKRSHVASVDKGREPWISDEGGRGQVTLRQKEKFMAVLLSFLPSSKDAMFVQMCRRRLSLGEMVRYQCLCEQCLCLMQMY
jgi:hypothetical protein